MSVDAIPESQAYRVTLFFGPEPVEDRPDAQYCVFNVKKRSWKAGIQVAVELTTTQLDTIRQDMRQSESLVQALAGLSEPERTDCEGRLPDLTAQAIAWCKLDLLLAAGLPQENQRLAPEAFVQELADSVVARRAYVLTYIMNELDLVQ